MEKISRTEVTHLLRSLQMWVPQSAAKINSAQEKEKGRTCTEWQNSSPAYNEEFNFTIDDEETKLELIVYDMRKTNVFLGSVWALEDTRLTFPDFYPVSYQHVDAGPASVLSSTLSTASC